MGKDIQKNTYSIIVIILFIISLGFAFTTFHFIGELSKQNQTYVGTIAISNYEENQYASIIASNLNEWKEDSNYVISYQNFDIDVNLDYFDVDISETISQINENQINDVIYSVSESNKTLFTQELATFYTASVINLIDIDELIQDIVNNIKKMSIINEYDLLKYFNVGVETTVLSSLTINGLVAADVNSITNTLTQLDIEAKSRFYLLESIQGLIMTNNQLTIIASGLQALTANSNLSSYIFEQNIETPLWGDEGMNVRILQTNNYDFSFYNDFSYSMSVSITKNDNTSITLELIGYPYVCDYSTSNIEVTQVDYQTLYEANETIDETTIGVITIDEDEDFVYQLLSQTGINGKIVKFERTTTFPDASIQKVILYYELYEPTDEVYQENIIPKDGE